MKKYSATAQAIDQIAMGDEARTLNSIARATRFANEHFWHDLKTGRKLKRNKGEMYMLMVSELAEAFEAHRKSKTATMMDSHIPALPAEVVEIADLYIRMMDFVGEFYPDTFGQAVVMKRQYNKTRKDHTREARLAPGGKAF